MPFGATLTYEQDAKAQRKARGAFFTPDELACTLVEGAVTRADARVLEPSCGEACFLAHARTRLRDLGATEVQTAANLFGCELHEQSADAARKNLRGVGASASISVCDFFDYEPSGYFDAVVGNPPYIRYQDFSGEARQKALARAQACGVKLSALCSSWAPFLVVCVSLLAPGGNLGMVLPAELLTVGYAAPVRKVLLESFGSLDITMYEERVFPEVQEEVVLLLARGKGAAGSGAITLHRRSGLGALSDDTTLEVAVPIDGSRWSALLNAGEQMAGELPDTFCRLSEWGRVSLGAVTGDNGFFALSEARQRELGIGKRHVLPLVPPGSQHLRKLVYSAAQEEGCRAVGQATRLFYPDVENLDGEALAYIAYGEAQEVSQRYKCRVRSPWWRVPVPKQPADVFVTYMNDVTVQLCTNELDAVHLNSVHGVRLNGGLKQLGRELLPLAALNSLTALSAEMEGRQYGGGILKVEPREAAALKVPSPQTVQACADELRRVRDKVEAFLSQGEVVQATSLVDEVILIGAEGMAPSDLESIRTTVKALRARRKARAKRASLG